VVLGVRYENFIDESSDNSSGDSDSGDSDDSDSDDSDDDITFPGEMKKKKKKKTVRAKPSTVWKPNVEGVTYDLDYFTRDVRKTKGEWSLAKKSLMFTDGFRVYPESEYMIEEFKSFYEIANVRKYEK